MANAPDVADATANAINYICIKGRTDKFKQLSAVRLFSGADFILSEFTDIYFEVKAVLYFDFYAVILPNEWQGFTPISQPNREAS